MKHPKLFAKIVYYIFTFSIGIFLALFLPYFYILGETLNYMQLYLEQGEYDKAMGLIGGFYDKQPLVEMQLPDGGGVVVFAAATLETDEEKGVDKLQKAYSGFLYGVQNKYVVSGTNNSSKIVVTDLEGNEHSFDILNRDDNNDGTNDNVSTMLNHGFVFFDFPQIEVDSVSEITFIDSGGKTFAEVDVGELVFSESFFADVDKFIRVYNADPSDEALDKLQEQFLSLNENYATSTKGAEPRAVADKRAAVVVVVYFVSVYVIADFLVGRRYILRFFKWLLVKVFKVKFKEKAPPKEEVFGHDYYCQVTIMLDVSAIPDFSDGVTVRYSNTEGEAEFLLLKENGYTVTQRVKAGTYVNLYTDLSKGYIAQNLPEKLVVEGYKKALKINIIRRED